MVSNLGIFDLYTAKKTLKKTPKKPQNQNLSTLRIHVQSTLKQCEWLSTPCFRSHTGHQEQVSCLFTSSKCGLIFLYSVAFSSNFSNPHVIFSVSYSLYLAWILLHLHYTSISTCTLLFPCFALSSVKYALIFQDKSTIDNRVMCLSTPAQLRFGSITCPIEFRITFISK